MAQLEISPGLLAGVDSTHSHLAARAGPYLHEGEIAAKNANDVLRLRQELFRLVDLTGLFVLPFLVETMSDKRPFVAETAAEATVRMVDSHSAVYRWNRFNPFPDPGITASHKALIRYGSTWQVAAILTLHGNGHVREAAVRKLAERSDGRGLAYLLNRCSDWVPVVQELARAALRAQTAAAPDCDVFRAIESAISDRHKCNGVDWLVDLIAREGIDRFEKGASTKGIRNSVIRYLAGWSTNRGREPLKWAGQSADALVRTNYYRSQLARMPDDEARATLHRLIENRMPEVRSLAVQTAATLEPVELAILEEGLLDRNRSTRSGARLSSSPRAHGFQSYPDFYRVHCKLPNAILGLGETGSAVDLPTLRDGLESGDRLRMIAAIEAVVRQGGEAEVAVLKTLLHDPAPGVARVALDSLSQMGATLEAEYLVDIATDGSASIYVRRNALAALNLCSRWEALAWLITFAPDPDLGPVASRRISQWLARAERGGLPPSRRRWQRVRDALTKSGLSLPPRLFVRLDRELEIWATRLGS